MPVFTITIHRYIYLFGLALLAFSLPLSPFGTSISQLIILINWILEGNFKEKWVVLKSRKSILLFSLIFIIHAIWLLPPQDYLYAFNDLKVKVPILVLPILIGTSGLLSKKLLRSILMFFSAGVILGSLISITIFMLKPSVNITNYRDLSPFISHIRFSLMIAFSVFILIYYSFAEREVRFSGFRKFAGIIFSLWLLVFLVLLKSLTGLIIFGIVSYIFLWVFSLKTKRWFKWIYFVLLIFLPLLPGFYIYKVSKHFTNIESVDFLKLENKTKSGNEYTFDPNSKSIENGNFVWVYYCEKELKNEWAKRSNIDYLGKDNNGNEIRYTLVRYLTSKGLRKDSVSICKLTNEEIKAVENGVPNYLFLNEWKVYPLIYNLFWQLNEYKNNNNASGMSLPQRIEYLKTAKVIISKNIWFGVGTGNVRLAFDKQYEIMNSSLQKEWRLRAHNQLVTFLLTFGIFGFALILFSFFYPAIKEKGFKNFLFSALFIIMFFSFLNEDTFETQAGVTFFILFYSLLIFSSKQEVVQNEQ
jgi:hypothetical protein